MKTNTFQIGTSISVMILAMAVAFPAYGQNANSAEIKGTVTDASNAVVPGADVVIQNTGTGVTIRTQTNGVGIYDVPSVPPGNYTITFSKTGFRDDVRTGIILHLATVAIDAVLQVGTASQQILVNADVPLLQTEDSAQHVDFDEQAVQNAPIVGGVWYNELTNELPGVNGGGSQDASGQGIGVNGTQAYSGSFLLEGSVAQEPRDANASDNYPPTDAIAEVSVQTSNFGAQYGNGVATFNALLKSGTNRFHGSLFEFNQNNDYNAVNYFSGPGTTVQPLHWNEFGGSVGGPIIKDKLFFYFTFQRNPNTSSFIETTTVPTQGANGTTNMEAGCFPLTYVDSNGKVQPVVISVPVSTSSTEQCLTGTVDPVAAKIQKYFPAPNLPGYVNNYKVVQSTPTTSTWYVGKVDYTPTQSHRISASYLDYPIGPITYNLDAFCSLGFDCTYGNNYNEDGQVTDVWTISSNKVNEARIGGVREVDKYIPPTYGKGYPTTIGLEPTYGTDAPADIFPTVTIASTDGIGGVGINGGIHAALADGALVESDVFTLIKGKHTVKMGGEFDKSYQNYTNWGDVSSGQFTFDGSSTNVAYADFLLGDVQTWNVYDYVETGARMWNLGAFVQDDYKVLPHLTVNLGFRYQYQGGWGEVQNRWGTFSPTVVNTGQYAQPGTLGAMLYGGQGRNTIQNGTNEWVPRVGLSWSPIPKWVFRASYGISDAPWSTDPYSAAYGIGLNPHGYESGTDVFQLQKGPGPGAVAYPTLSNLSNSQYNYDNVSYFPAKRPVTYYQESLLSIQHEMPFQMLVDASYLYTKGTHLGFYRDINAVPISGMTQYTTCYNSYVVPTAYPLFCSIGAALYDGYSNYNALQLRVQKRTSYGLNFIFNYAWSKTMDTGTGSGNDSNVDTWQNAFSVKANYGLSTLDTKNSITGSATYELPFGGGKTFALHGVADEVLGGWRATGVFQVHSGIPFTATVNGADESGSGVYNTCYCGYSWRPNEVASPSVSHPSVSEWFNPAAFTVPTYGTFGNENRNTLIGPNWRDLDLGLGKTFQLIEGVKFEIKADSFNAFNHPNLEGPSAAVGQGAGDPGVITTANGARSIQLGGRLTF
ncbi:MAG: TonB-dependent receptor [Terracidiphilus sp.]